MEREELLRSLVSCITLAEKNEKTAHRMAEWALLIYLNDPEITELFEEIQKIVYLKE